MAKKTIPFKLKKKERQFLIFAFCWCLILSIGFFSLLKNVWLGSKAVDVASTFSGMVGIFVSFFGSILVYKALQSQIKANKIISEQFKIQQFESQFYEMLKLHKENVNEIEIESLDYSFKGNFIAGNYECKNIKIKGRDAFVYLCNELEISFNMYKDFVNNENISYFDFTIPYKAFFNGADELDNDFFQGYYKKNADSFGYNYLANHNLNPFFNTKVKSLYKLFDGHENKLGHYYRHLFHMVKFVAEQNTSFISYEEKRKYLRLLRAQLSNYEQAMLFYNYLAYAPEWEEGNKFFTNYRIIHNLYDNVLIDDAYFKNELNKLKLKQSEAYCYKDNDHIFESQRWGMKKGEILKCVNYQN